MLKQRITKSQPSKKNFSPIDKSSVDSENSTHSFFNNQNQKSTDFDKTIENENNQNKNNILMKIKSSHLPPFHICEKMKKKTLYILKN